MLRFIQAINPEVRELKREAQERLKQELAVTVGVVQESPSGEIEVTGGPEIEEKITEAVGQSAMSDAPPAVVFTGRSVTPDRAPVVL